MHVLTSLLAGVVLLFATVDAAAFAASEAGGEVASNAAVVLEVPYRSQMDGSPYQTANCGPTTVSMLLGYFGIEASQWEVRVRAMKAQGSWVDDEGGYSDNYGVFVQHLATVVESYGLRTQGLWRREGIRIDRLREWTADDLRAAVRDGKPVVLQVRFRALPGRSESPFRGDHYILVHGYRGDSFVYSDPMDREGGGPDRTIPQGDLASAMRRASVPNVGFAAYARPGSAGPPTAVVPDAAPPVHLAESAPHRAA